jgi:uncharacterized alpha-E superfamily protein
MLSRTAANLYWMSRYLERAENTARLLDATQTMALMPRSRRARRELTAPLAITGMEELYRERYEELTTGSLMRFFVLDEANYNSIYNCIRMARDNALSVRGELSQDVWESINGAWLEMRAIQRTGDLEQGVKAFFDWMKQQSNTFRGAVHGTTIRDDSFQFMRLGTFLERADNTARILDVRYEVMKRSRSQDEAVDFYQWNALLQSLSAYEIYHEHYRSGINDRNVAELLILSGEVPRSLRWCVGQMLRTLNNIAGGKGMTAKRLAAELWASLQYGEIDHIMSEGIHRYLTKTLESINEIARQVHRSYWQGHS